MNLRIQSRKTRLRKKRRKPLRPLLLKRLRPNANRESSLKSNARLRLLPSRLTRRRLKRRNSRKLRKRQMLRATASREST